MQRTTSWDIVDHWAGTSSDASSSATSASAVSQPSAASISSQLASFQKDLYKYDSLNAANNEIRVLAIQPGRFRDPIICNMRKVSLSMNPSFEALSYSWGNPRASNEITINGRVLGVAANLHVALRYLRFERSTRIMWIDAICVNQANLAERSEQVLHMAKIYSSAWDVIIWLGESSLLLDKLFETMDIILGIGQRARATALERERLEMKKRLGVKTIRNLKDAMPQHGYPTPMDLDGEIKDAVSELFSRPWWTRMWVLQEFLLARDSSLLCGKYRIPWIDFYDFISCEYSNENIPTLKLGKTVASIGVDLHQLRNVIKTIRQKLPGNTSDGMIMKLSDLMLQFEHYQASDPRDKIYALFDIAGDSRVVLPDYNASLESVYTKLTKALIIRWKNLDIICKHHRGARILSLPSWVPDWTVQRELPFQWSGARGTNIQALSAVREPYDASGSRPVQISFEAKEMMISQSIQYDTVRHVIDLDAKETFNWPLKLFEKLADIHFDMSFDVSAYHREAIVKRYWRTLLHDMRWDSSERMSDDDDLQLSEQLTVPSFSFGALDIYTGPSHALIEHATRLNNDYSFAISEKEHMALVPKATREGDAIHVLMGGQVPFILRRRPHSTAPDLKRDRISGEFEMIGPAYVHGIMDGEAVKKQNVVQIAIK